MRTSSHTLWLLLAVGACGKVNTLADAGLDADPHGTVMVTVLNTDQSGTAVQGVPVVFFDPDGTMVAKTASDAQGHASATVLPGANVNIIWPRSATAYQIATIYDIKPNDNLVVGFRNPDVTDAGTFSVTFDPYSGATSYRIFGPCGTADANNVLAFQNWCKSDTFDTYILARDANGAPLAWNSKSNVAFSAGTTNFDAAGWNFASDFTAAYNDLPTGIATIDMRRVSGFPQEGFAASTSGTPSGTTLSLAVTAPGGGTNAWVSSGFTRTNGTVQQIRQRVAGASTSYGLDVSANLLPWISAPMFDPSKQQLSVTAEGTGTYDMYLADIQYSRMVGTDTIGYEWIALGPTIGTFTMPALPADVGDVNPKATDTLGTPIAILIDDDGDGWDSVRATVFDEFRAALLGSSTAQRIRVSETASTN